MLEIKQLYKLGRYTTGSKVTIVLEQLPAWLRFCNVFAKKSC